jgi:flagellar biosynthetic protein FlhB
MTAVIFLAVLVFEIVQTGLVFSTEPLRIDFGKLSPAKGFKRVFSLRMLIETGKNVLKLLTYGAIAAFVIHGAQASFPTIVDASSLAGAMGHSALGLLSFFVAAAVVFAALDQLIVRRDFLKKMRMSRREVRREARDREGEPRMKQRRKQLHRQYALQSQSLRGVKGADVLITNPTHYAVALKYEAGAMVAPAVVSQGAHQFAQRLKRLAFLYGVVIVEDRLLARELFAKAALGAPIPEIHYKRVADIYLAMRRQNATRQ